MQLIKHLMVSKCLLLLDNRDYKTVHGWRYANNAKREISPVFLDQNLKLAACGDWCLGGRVEGFFALCESLRCERGAENVVVIGTPNGIGGFISTRFFTFSNRTISHRFCYKNHLWCKYAAIVPCLLPC